MSGGSVTGVQVCSAGGSACQGGGRSSRRGAGCHGADNIELGTAGSTVGGSAVVIKQDSCGRRAFRQTGIERASVLFLGSKHLQQQNGSITTGYGRFISQTKTAIKTYLRSKTGIVIRPEASDIRCGISKYSEHHGNSLSIVNGIFGTEFAVAIAVNYALSAGKIDVACSPVGAGNIAVKGLILICVHNRRTAGSNNSQLTKLCSCKVLAGTEGSIRKTVNDIKTGKYLDCTFSSCVVDVAVGSCRNGENQRQQEQQTGKSFHKLYSFPEKIRTISKNTVIGEYWYQSLLRASTGCKPEALTAG